MLLGLKTLPAIPLHDKVKGMSSSEVVNDLLDKVCIVNEDEQKLDNKLSSIISELKSCIKEYGDGPHPDLETKFKGAIENLQYIKNGLDR